MNLFGDRTRQHIETAQATSPIVQGKYDRAVGTWSAFPAGAEITTFATPIFMFGNSRITSDTFGLRYDVDWKPVQGVPLPPGKSASIDFCGFSEVDCVPEAVLEWMVMRQFGRSRKRQDNIWHTNVGEIQSAGFSALYAPRSHDPLHVRLCATQLRRITPQEYRDYVASKAFEKSTDRLAKIWRRMPVSK